MKAIHPNKLKVGDVVEQWVHFDHCPQEMKMVGEVIWIHPDKRFYRVRFPQPHGSFTESYTFYGKQSGTAYTPDHTKNKVAPVMEGRMKY